MTHLYEENILLLTDGYKPSHWKQIPPGTTHLFSYFESRGGDFPVTTFFGLQYYVKRYLTGVVVTEEKIQEAKEFFAEYFGDDTIFNEAGWRRILEVHGGKLPVEIRAVPEGLRVPGSNTLLTIMNTDPELAWLTNYLETLLSMVWYSMTVATQSRAMKDIIIDNLERTGDPTQYAFKLHDFGFRGSTSVESSGIGGAAHLVNFMGTDTLSGIINLRRFYHAKKMPGFSIPASEHSTITSWGRAFEGDAYENMLKAFPKGFVAVVSDSYDIFNACENLWGDRLRDQILNREGTLVIRPDSGHPPTVVVQVLEILGRRFGYTINTKGYKVLDPHVRVIQGDGIDIKVLKDILDAMDANGWSGDNIAFGSGGGLLQKVNRDTLKCAFKCCAILRNGEWVEVMKDPITDPGKRSKAGKLVLIHDGVDYRTVKEEDTDLPNILELVFRDGELMRDETIDEIRERAAA